jgi:serine/threonine protein kinase
MAPEVIRMAEPDPYTPYCDVYSFGVVIYELITGQLPYSHVEGRDTILFMVGCGFLRPDPSNARKDTPKIFKQLCVRCCQFKKEDRPLFPQAPEVIRMAEPDPYTPYCDVYSFGVVIYELITGQLPYSHVEGRDTILFMVGCGFLRPDPSNARKDTPKIFKQLCVRCCQFKKEDRPLFPQILVDLDTLADNMPKIKRCNSEPSLLHYAHIQPPAETFVLPDQATEEVPRGAVTVGTLV